MTDPTPTDAVTPDRPRRRRRILRGVWRSVAVPVGALLASFGIGLVVLVLVLQDAVTLSPAMAAKFEDQITRALPDGLSARLDQVQISLSPGLKPRVDLAGLTLLDKDKAAISRFPDLTLEVARRSFLGFKPRPERIVLDGTAMVLRRDADGNLSLGFDTGGALPKVETLAGLVDQIERSFDTDAMSHITQIDIRNLTLIVDDLRAGRTFTLSNGQLALTRSDTDLSIALSAALDSDADTARLALRLDTTRHSPKTDLSVEVSKMPARLLAEQTVYLSWLKALDAPISAQFRGGLVADGGVSDLSGAVELGAGKLRLPGLAAPIATESAKAYLSYAPENRKVTLTALTLASDLLRFEAEGYAYLHSIEDPFRILMGQLRLSRVMMTAPDQYDAPLILDNVIADWRIDGPAARVELGQLVVLQDKARLTAGGTLDITADGPRLHFDALLDRMQVAQIFALWPKTVKPQTLDYFGTNLTEGEVENVSFALRQAPGGVAHVGITGAFAGARMRYLPELTPIEGGWGHFAYADHKVTVNVAGAHLRPEGYDTVDLGGSVFQAVGLDDMPGTAIIDLSAVGPVSALLAGTEAPPIQSTDKLGVGPDAMGGQGRITGQIRLPLKFEMLREEVELDLEGRLVGLNSDTLVPGQDLRAGVADLRLRDGILTLTGSARVSDVPLRLALTQPIEDGAPGQLRGNLNLSAQTLEKLGISLPDGLMTGAAAATLDIALSDGPPVLTLTSDLGGLGMAISPLGWRKPAAGKGDLSLTATLGPTPEVTDLRLEAAGLTARGTLRLADGGGLDRARFTTLKIGKWLDITADLIGRGAARPMDIAVTGGRVDLGGMPEDGGGGAGATGPGTPRGEITLALDRVDVPGGLFLTGVQGRIAAGTAMSARVTGRVGGKAPVTVELSGATANPGIRVMSSDAGAVLTTAGLLDAARGGDLLLELYPRKGARRSGMLNISGLTVISAPSLTKLLSAVSVIGLVEQISTGGLFFAETDAKFSIGTDGVLVTESRAQGPSLGLTARGLIGTGPGAQMELSGVVSPFYVVNRLYGALLARKGEGLIGFNYTMEGPRADPNVRVNPLSILTPGALREIFRRPLPDVED